MTTRIIIEATPYPPDDDNCYQCDLPAHTNCGLCRQPVCTDHSYINPTPHAPPLCPPCYTISHTATTVDNIEEQLERIERLLAAIPTTRGLHGQN